MDMATMRTSGVIGWVASAALLLLVACAQVGMPSGGAKDETPPTLLSATPPIGSTNVTTNSITLVFDEYVRAGQWRTELLVSPPLVGPVDLVVRGKEVEVTWEEPLAANTTYVWQFGQGIVDVNEGNAAKGLVHAFATGPELDTLSIAGRVVDALDGSGVADMRVMVFPAALALDSVVAGNMPQFVGATDGQGRFEVGYLPEGAYRVLALKDESRNQAWDPGEQLALGPARVTAGDSTVHVMKAGTTPAPRAPYLSEAVRDSLGFARWKLSEPMSHADSLSWVTPMTMVLFPPHGDRVCAQGWNVDLDSVDVQLVWHQAPTWPNAPWRRDTLDVPKPRVTPVEDMVLRSKPLGKRPPGEQARLGWSAPVSFVDTALLQVLLDSVAVPAQVNQRMPSIEFTLAGEGLAQPGAQVELTMLPGCLKRPGTDQSLPQDTLALVWSVLKEEELGQWSLNVVGVRCPGLLEVNDGKGERLDLIEVGRDTVLSWSGMNPGKISATWWGDLDGDGVWRNVDLATWRVPESVSYMPPVDLRANWVVETSWVLDSTMCAQPQP